ncbi:MAG: acyl-CoA reductase [Algoriphagus sp.]|nr:acyl-CoA reductase [Algoriphagus sp.]
MHANFPLSDRISAFIRLGNLLSDLEGDEKFVLFQQAQNQNAWFTPQSLDQALKGIQVLLDAEAMEKWVANYSFSETAQPQQIGLMLAGNIPGVGFHDILAVLIAGHSACIKLSSQDTALPLWLLGQLKAIEPRFSERIFIEELLKNKQAYIATGSDNSARYFNYYFGKYPHLIRSNRTSVAILQGDESLADLQALGHDIFDYFGLGCRNVSKVFVKNQAQLTQLLDAIQAFDWVANHHKYFNNYEYNKSIYLVNGTPHLDNGFLLLKESVDLVSPIGVLFYEVYEDEAALQSKLSALASQIQCVVGHSSLSIPGIIPFGQTQCPAPWDYADGVDTLQFLSGLGV